jgi:hypothetical protein
MDFALLGAKSKSDLGWKTNPIQGKGSRMIDGVAGIVLKLNPKNEDLETMVRAPGRGGRMKEYLRRIRIEERYNVPKRRGDLNYKYLQPSQWLLLYDPTEQAVTFYGKVADQEYREDNPDFPCYNNFERETMRFPSRKQMPLHLLNAIFRNFYRSRRYRNMTQRQFDRLLRH